MKFQKILSLFLTLMMSSAALAQQFGRDETQCEKLRVVEAQIIKDVEEIKNNVDVIEQAAYEKKQVIDATMIMSAVAAITAANYNYLYNTVGTQTKQVVIRSMQVGYSDEIKSLAEVGARKASLASSLRKIKNLGIPMLAGAAAAYANKNDVEAAINKLAKLKAENEALIKKLDEATQILDVKRKAARCNE